MGFFLGGGKGGALVELVVFFGKKVPGGELVERKRKKQIIGLVLQVGEYDDSTQTLVVRKDCTLLTKKCHFNNMVKQHFPDKSLC